MQKIVMVVLSSFPRDVRVRREAEALMQEGNTVDVICITRRGEPRLEVVNNIQTYRIPLRRSRSGKMNYLWDYFYFFSWAFLRLSILFFKKKYDVIHVHNMPDFLIYTAIFPKIFSKRIILDLHDPMPELFMTMFPNSKDGFVINFLKWMEKRCINFADVVITPNISFRNAFISRGCPPEKINIVMNSPDENIFGLNGSSEINRKGENFIIMCHGTILRRSGIDLLVEAVSQACLKIPNLKVLIYGDGEYLNNVKLRVQELNLSSIVEIKGSVIVDEIAEAIKGIDLGIIPNRLNSFTQINFPVRIFEYLVMNKPVIVPKTQGILDYFKEDSIFFFSADDAQSLAHAIIKVYESPENTKKVLEYSVEVFNKYRWKSQKQNLIDITNSFLVKPN